MYINKLLFLLFFTLPLVAENTFETKFNYFGNVGLSALDSKGYDLNHFNQDNINDSISLSPHSKIGLQVTLIKDDFTFTAQGLLREVHDSVKTDFTWLNMKYDINDNYAIRLGRIQTKMFLHSESLHLDYLHLWTKAPAEVYSLMPVGTFDGVELSYNKIIGEYNFNASLVLFGSYRDEIYSHENRESILEVKDSSSIYFTLENDKVLYKASYSRSKTNIGDDITTKVIVQGLEAYGNNMSRYSYEEKEGDIYSLGFQYKGESLIVDAEIAHFESNGLFPSSTGAYALLGYNINAFTPFVMYAENKNEKSHFDTSAIQTPDITSVTLKRGLDDIMYLTNFSQKTASIGIRYDLAVGLALKAQVDRISTSNYGDISPFGVGTSGLQRLGILSRDAGIEDKPVYAFTFSISFAY
ncbi:MAG: hypothetical protein Q9M36_00730 [Sulfurovum sp.]|nr:hypothetical protein [Sulfurovum sp.]